jgi:hypothetical protein
MPGPNSGGVAGTEQALKDLGSSDCKMNGYSLADKPVTRAAVQTIASAPDRLNRHKLAENIAASARPVDTVVIQQTGGTKSQ